MFPRGKTSTVARDLRSAPCDNVAVKERGWYRTGLLLGGLVRVWRTTLRIEAVNREALAGPCVLAVWHGRLMGVLMDQAGSGLVTMASRSADGALAAGAVRALGLCVTRGSSSRGGGEALMEMRAALRGGAPRAALTVDGPHGPWRRVQAGAVVLARRLAIPLVPATFSCRRGSVLGSWDRMLLPRPFTRVVVAYGEPWEPARLRVRSEEATAAIAEDIDRLTARLDEAVAGRRLWADP